MSPLGDDDSLRVGPGTKVSPRAIVVSLFAHATRKSRRHTSRVVRAQVPVGELTRIGSFCSFFCRSSRLAKQPARRKGLSFAFYRRRPNPPTIKSRKLLKTNDAVLCDLAEAPSISAPGLVHREHAVGALNPVKPAEIIDSRVTKRSNWGCRQLPGPEC